jgi:1-acyl-sn-glycerol-3-phosphate acyltransferase
MVAFGSASALDAASLVGPTWHPPRRRDYLGWKMPHSGRGDGWLFRSLGLLGRPLVSAMVGLEHIQPERDPFILAINHTSRREAIIVPMLFFLHRGGRLLHFLADWNFMLIPGIGLIYRRSKVIVMTGKGIRPAFLNVLKPAFADSMTPLDRAQQHLSAGRSVGVFPEGTVNPDPAQLLRGRLGAARLALDSGVPVVPAGIRIAPGRSGDRPFPPLEIHIGAPLDPPKGGRGSRTTYEFHARIMRRIAELSGKPWK